MPWVMFSIAPLQQGAVELQHLGGFVGDPHHVLHLHLAPFDGGLHHRPRRGRAEDPGEQALGVRDPLVVGGLVRGEALALAVGEADEALPRAFLADETRGEHQQVFHLHREHEARVLPLGYLLADEAAGLPVLGHAGAREHRDQAEQGEVADQRDQHALGQRLDRQAEGIACQPGQAGDALQRPAKALGHHRQDQRIGPQQRAGGEAGEDPAAVGLFPVQRADHRRAELGDGGEGDLADGRQAGAGAEQAVGHVGEQQDHRDAHPAHGQQPVTEGLEGPFGVLSRRRSSHGRSMSLETMVDSATLATMTIPVAAEAPPMNANRASAGCASASGRLMTKSPALPRRAGATGRRGRSAPRTTRPAPGRWGTPSAPG